MKFTPVLYKIHLGRMVKRNWFFHTRQILGESGSEPTLAKMGIPVIDPEEILNPPRPKLDINQFFDRDVYPRPIPMDETHPGWKERPCLKLNTNDLLVMGTDQAQVLTKTLLVKDGLPDKIEESIKDTSEEVNKIVERIVYASNIFDAHQEKLPKRIDPARPAFGLPRDYGLTDFRKSRNLSQKMIQLCELLCGPSVVSDRQLVYNGRTQIPLEKDNDLVMFNMTVDMMITANKSLTPVGNFEDVKDLTLPNIYPLSPMIYFPEEHIYEREHLYPVPTSSPWVNPHTIFIYHDQVKVQNITELPVTKNQLLARSLIKSFTAAASYAYQKFGTNIKDLPEPITVQCVQSNGQSFHFSVFQLNTLNISGTEGIKNLWWSMPEIDLFNKAGYEEGKPLVEGYNPEVFKRISAFYNSQ
ncbi:39S ribosomal protein L37, mitochondrial [Microplitis mediator]|uniref:39S ribosomal protein L37, mitochondrial n=1 Tax=Microplitis mediator TaxID=375433 RepID=UPI0025541F56|nr:39S ribosomal protein L37, mitochondrial [Microplitis mediator]